ncbi:MAG: HDOD domain-containing protein [Massilia sp.]|nr:HDOD domain-containing protein [Massilia sp.]
MDQSDHDIRNRLLVARLPGMPQILIKLIEHLQADDLGMVELAALIAGDAGMTAKILTVANSSAYRRASRTASLEQSLVALGTDALKTLVISESVFQTFNSFPHSSSTDLRRFWRTSLTAAVVARDLAVRMEYPHVEEAYLAGLLHNVGRLALLAAAPKEYAFNFNAHDDDALCAVEQRTLHITHAEAGAWLIERWNLDSFLADAVLYHHETNARLEASHPLIRIVRLAHLMASHPEDDAARADAARLCDLALEQVDAIGAACARQVEQAAAQLGIDLAGADDVASLPALPALQSGAPAPFDPVRQRLADEMRNLVLVAQVGQSFARQQGESGLLESMARSARMLFDFDNTVILLENPGGAALVGMPDASAPRHAEFSLPLVRGGVVADAALERRLAFIGRDAQPLGVAEEQLFRLLGSDALVCMPLLTGGRCLGLMIGGMAAWKLASCQQRASFMAAFAAQAAGALEVALSERGLARRQLADVAEQYREASRQVVHEVNNPLAIIKNYLSVLDDKLARREPVIGEMAILNEEIDRVGQLINGLAELPAGVPAMAVGTSATDATRVVDEVLRLFRATGFAPPEVQIVVSKHADAAHVDADAATLKQILINLLKNAIEALGRSGRIEIAHRGHVHRNGALYVELAISDNGPGLAPEALAGLFSAVRSSKAGAHRGLGLSIVQGLVNKLGGIITCRSGSGGSTFEILLPARASAGVMAAPRLPALDAV